MVQKDKFFGHAGLDETGFQIAPIRLVLVQEEPGGEVQELLE